MSDNIKRILLENRIYFILLFSVLLISGIFLISTPHGEELFLIRDHYSESLVDFFYIFTYLGNGLIQAVILLPLFFYRFRIYIIFLIVHIISGAFAQLLKLIFATPRPKIYFSNFDYFYLYPNEILNNSYSFPSGHTTSIFAICLLLAIVSKNKFLNILFFVIALLVGISRLFLYQHFLVDVYFGMIIGTIFSLIIYSFFAISKNKDKLLTQTFTNYIIEKKTLKASNQNK